MDSALTPGSQPIYNPPIPFCSRINGGLRVGMCLYVQGKVPHHVDRFHINLRCGQSDDSDIALHFNPRFGWFEKVIFNSFEGGSWSSEEKKHELPFQKGEHFEVVFIVKQDSYQVNVNGGSFYEFKHRIPLERVEFLQVAGDVTIESIKFGTEAGGFGSNMVITSGGTMPDPSYNPGVMPGGMGMPGYQPGNMPGGMGMPGYQPGNIPGMMPDNQYNPADMPGGMNMPGYQPGNFPGTMPAPSYNPAEMSVYHIWHIPEIALMHERTSSESPLQARSHIHFQLDSPPRSQQVRVVAQQGIPPIHGMHGVDRMS